MPRPRKPIPALPQIDLLIPPVKQTAYRFFAPAAHRPAFETTPTAAVSWANAWWLADFAALAYGDRDYIAQGLDGTGFSLRDTHCFARQGTKCFVAASDQAIVVTFCGTEAPQFDLRTLLTPGASVFALGHAVSTLALSSAASAFDWMRNAQLQLSAFSRDQRALGRVHSGFLEGFSAVEDDVVRTVNQLLTEKNRPLWFTGHSLGGALAHLAAVRLNKPAGLYTFGCPRVGDAAFVNAFPATIMTRRFCVLGDPTPLVPLPALTGLGNDYRHVGNAFWLAENAAPRDSTDTLVQLAPPNPVHHAPVIYSNLLWNLLPA